MEESQRTGTTKLVEVYYSMYKYIVVPFHTRWIVARTSILQHLWGLGAELSITGPVDSGLVKLYEPSQHHVCMWLQRRTWWAASPLCRYFWLAMLLQRSITCTASERIPVSRWDEQTQQWWTAGVAAMSMRLICGGGTLDVVSHAWAVCPLRQLNRGCNLTGLKAISVGLRPVGGARRIEPN